MGADQRLKDEITDDPLLRSYSTMSDIDLTNSLNALDRSQNRGSMSASEVYNQIDETEWLALTDPQRDEIWNIIHLTGELNPFGLEADRFLAIFGAGTTITALNAARVTSISRAAEIGIGFASLGDVIAARA